MRWPITLTMPIPRNCRMPDRRRRCQRRFETLQPRRLMAGDLEASVADQNGATWSDNGEFLLGRVVVTPVFFESDGSLDLSTQNWTDNEIAATIDKVVQGVTWWERMLDSLDTVHELDFVFDTQFAETPFETGYEPIDRGSDFVRNYGFEFLDAQGIEFENSFNNMVAAFNDAQRIRYDADWSFTIFVVDSSDDADGLFASGGSFSGAFALPGGLFVASPSTRPASTFAHEMGHIFWARDEYPGGGSYTDRRGYYNAPNLNAFDNPEPGFVQQPSIMAGGEVLRQAYENVVSPASTLAMVGWRDSDGDGIFDVLDVPLELDGVGRYVPGVDGGTLSVTAQASAEMLFNRNSSGNQPDVTLNRVDAIQYRVGDGPWTDVPTDAVRLDSVTTLAGQTVNSRLGDRQIAFSIDMDFDAAIDDPIALRVIDQTVGVTSDPLIIQTVATIGVGAATLDVDGSGVSGAALFDVDGNGVPNAADIPLEGTVVTATQVGGAAIEPIEISAADFAPGFLTDADMPEGIALRIEGSDRDPGAAVVEDQGRIVFGSFDDSRNRFDGRFDNRVTLVAEFDRDFSVVEIDYLARLPKLSGPDVAYATIDALDAEGNFVTRVAAGAVDIGDTGTVRVDDPQGRIRSIRVTGFAGTFINIDSIRGGGEISTTIDATSGLWQLPDLGPGTYEIGLRSPNMVYDFAPTTVTVNDAGVASPIDALATQIDSLRHRVGNRFDVDGVGGVDVSDVLAVVTELRRFGGQSFLERSSEGPAVDVNNNGLIDTVDALLVINELRRRGGSGGEGESFGSGESFRRRGIGGLAGNGDRGDFADRGDRSGGGDQNTPNLARTNVLRVLHSPLGGDWTNHPETVRVEASRIGRTVVRDDSEDSTDAERFDDFWRLYFDLSEEEFDFASTADYPDRGSGGNFRP